MKKYSPIVRRATRADILSFSELERNPSTRSWVMEIDGRIVAMGGVALINKRWFAFFDAEDEALPYKMTIMRSAIRFLKEQQKSGTRIIYAELDWTKPNAARWMQSLGFELDPVTQYLFRWRQ